MCGIFGIIGPATDSQATQRAVAALWHRGPDSQGSQTLDGATLAHTRLRIIDLSAAGSQPMQNEDGTVWTTFNGEIYNFKDLREQLEASGHRFRSHSDTEVLVHGYEEWGEGLVGRLDGMFAFAVWDTKTRKVLLARDRSGKKPLYYAHHDGRLYFASEIKALFAAGLPTDVDPAGVVAFLAYGYVPAPGTLYKGISQLPPGHYLALDNGAAAGRSRAYWSFDFNPSSPPPSEGEAKARIRELLTDAVRKRLVADVPVGAFLSGGLDSTIVVGLMARLGHKARTFSIGFSSDPRFDETKYARLVAKKFGTEHTEFDVGPADLDLIERLVWHHDGPFGDSSAIPTYVVSRLTRERVTVALTGDGGDELFAGYLRFWAAQTSERIPSPLRSLAGLAHRFVPDGHGSRSFVARARRMLGAMNLPLGDRLILWNSFFALSMTSIINGDLTAHVEPGLAFAREYFRGIPRTPLAAALNHNFGMYLPYDLLVKVDRMSMANALETRSPFLDTALIDYVSRLPDNFKLRGRTTKYILRRTFSDLIPDEINRRGKMGFGVPLGTWFRGDLSAYVHDHLGSADAKLYQYVRRDAVQRLLRDHMSGIADNEHQIWALLTMEIWLRSLTRLGQPWNTSGEYTEGAVPLALRS